VVFEPLRFERRKSGNRGPLSQGRGICALQQKYLFDYWIFFSKVILSRTEIRTCATSATFGIGMKIFFFKGATKLSGLGLQNCIHLRPIGRDEEH
jgi:hypothetical protein